jgi:zinc transporter ZupT
VDYPSLGFTLATIGTLIVLASEQITLMLVSRIEAENKEVDIELPAHPKLTPIDPTRLDSQPEEVKTQRKVYHSFYQNHSFLDVEIGHPEHPELTLTDPKRLDSQPEEVETQQKTYQSCCDHTAAVDLIARSNSMSVLIKAYMMEISIGIHSLIIGIAMGSLEGRENLESLRGLVIAICFHQFFEGLGLG